MGELVGGIWPVSIDSVLKFALYSVSVITTRQRTGGIPSAVTEAE